MEDHLKNKNRLEKEWEALCAYQAEPNSSLVAQREENTSKNRSLAVLTCTYPASVSWRGERGWITGRCELHLPEASVLTTLSSTACRASLPHPSGCRPMPTVLVTLWEPPPPK
jgi:hypothetical protein